MGAVSNYVVMPQTVHRDQVRTTTTTVVCGPSAKIREVVGAAALAGSQNTMLASGADLREYADRHAPADVAIIVTPLPDGPAVPLIRMLRARGWNRVIVLSGKADARAVFATVSAGVRGVIVHQAQDQNPAPVRRAGSAILSDRELEVLRMVADGQSNKTVGEHLGLSALTVKSHLARIARKLGCGDRAEMVATAIRAGYIS